MAVSQNDLQKINDVLGRVGAGESCMRKNAAIGVTLAVLFSSHLAVSADIQAAATQVDTDGQKRHRVIRYYEMLSSCSRCPTEGQDSCNFAVSEFKLTYPDLMDLINQSPYKAYAEQQVKSRRRALEMSECKWLDDLLRASVQNESARDMVWKDIRLLEQRGVAVENGI